MGGGGWGGGVGGGGGVVWGGGGGGAGGAGGGGGGGAEGLGGGVGVCGGVVWGGETIKKKINGVGGGASRFDVSPMEWAGDLRHLSGRFLVVFSFLQRLSRRQPANDWSLRSLRSLLAPCLERSAQF